MKKRPIVGLITTAENTRAQLIQDATLLHYSFVQTSAAGVVVLGPIKYGTTKRLVYTNPQREVRNTVLIGGATVEVIAAATRYKVEIWNSESEYETHAQSPLKYAFTSAATLTGTAATDRTNVYTELASRINAYADNNVTAYLLTQATFTGATDSGDGVEGFIIGEIVDQETSTETAQVAAWSLSSGTFVGDNGAGTIWLYNLSSTALWETGAKTLTGAAHVPATTLIAGTTSCVVTATLVAHGQGLVLVDDANYFLANDRGGINNVALTAGFTVATATSVIVGQYSEGVGADMLARVPVFDLTKQNILSGNIEYDFSNSAPPVSGQSYEKIQIFVQDGDEDSISGNKVASETVYVLWFNDSSHADYTTDLEVALTAAALL